MIWPIEANSPLAGPLLLDIRGTLNHLVKVETRHLTGSDDTRWTAVTPAISEKIDHEVGNLMIKTQILNSTIMLNSVKKKNHYSGIQHLVGLIAPLWICTNIYLMIEQHLSYLEPFLSQKWALKISFSHYKVENNDCSSFIMAISGTTLVFFYSLLI